MTRRMLLAVPLLLLAGCGEEPTFSTSGGTFGGGPNTKIASITTASEFQLRPRRIDDRFSFTTSFAVEHAKGQVLEDVRIEFSCLDLALQGGRNSAGQTPKGRELPGGKVDLTVTLAGRYGLTAADRRDRVGEDDACFQQGSFQVAKEAVATLRDGDERHEHEVPLSYPVVLMKSAR